ncbi:MAG: lysophospholipid acyltransferase family protein, partial [Blastocatellia bacterium]
AKPHLYAVNHTSAMDIPMLYAHLPFQFRIIAKKELFKYPIFGPGIGLMKVVPIDRKNSQAAVEGAKKATENLRSGKSYVVYPEGTRSPDGRLLGFKKGAFLMAADAGVPVVPVTVSGSSALMPKGKIRLTPGVLQLKIHEPVSTAGYTRENVSKLMEQVRTRIRSGLSEEEIALE